MSFYEKSVAGRGTYVGKLLTFPSIGGSLSKELFITFFMTCIIIFSHNTMGVLSCLEII